MSMCRTVIRATSRPKWLKADVVSFSSSADIRTYSSVSSSQAQIPQMWFARVSASWTSEGTRWKLFPNRVRPSACTRQKLQMMDNTRWQIVALYAADQPSSFELILDLPFER